MHFVEWLNLMEFVKVALCPLPSWTVRWERRLSGVFLQWKRKKKGVVEYLSKGIGKAMHACRFWAATWHGLSAEDRNLQEKVSRKVPQWRMASGWPCMRFKVTVLCASSLSRRIEGEISYSDSEARFHTWHWHSLKRIFYGWILEVISPLFPIWMYNCIYILYLWIYVRTKCIVISLFPHLF